MCIHAYLVFYHRSGRVSGYFLVWGYTLGYCGFRWRRGLLGKYVHTCLPMVSSKNLKNKTLQGAWEHVNGVESLES
jgi:hypothetical protein